MMNGSRMRQLAVCIPEYGEMRNEVPSEGRWISPEDVEERRRVVVLGARLKKETLQRRTCCGRNRAHQTASVSPLSAPWT